MTLVSASEEYVLPRVRRGLTKKGVRGIRKVRPRNGGKGARFEG